MYSTFSVNFVNLLKTGDWAKVDIPLSAEDGFNIDKIISYFAERNGEAFLIRKFGSEKF